MDLLECNLPGLKKLRSGKVRDVYDLGDCLLFVATDRISAFDCILPNPIPRKGEVLTQISAFWFEKLDFVQNHLITADFRQFPESVQKFADQLAGRSMLVKKASPLPVECVARGYLAGSGWKEYKEKGTVCGQPLPPGLTQSARLPETIFTPATKAEEGHDENISWSECRAILGDDVALSVRDFTIELYEHGRAYAATQGIIVADTKFEFGILDGEIVLIDECLTPDSSRFWPESEYVAGGSPPSFDKQFVRDYLEGLDWDKTPPAPSLPAEIIEKTSAKYLEAYERLVGLKL
jgi:phosphoribosylaminoimidazole-succinocarboxamide synthase